MTDPYDEISPRVQNLAHFFSIGSTWRRHEPDQPDVASRTVIDIDETHVHYESSAFGGIFKVTHRDWYRWGNRAQQVFEEAS